MGIKEDMLRLLDKWPPMPGPTSLLVTSEEMLPLFGGLVEGTHPTYLRIAGIPVKLSEYLPANTSIWFDGRGGVTIITLDGKLPQELLSEDSLF